jgi:5-methylcytosine-specific restriction enzyme subunit McrC
VRLTVYEQGLLPVREFADEEKGVINLEQAAGLVDLGNRIEARIATWQSPKMLRLNQFVGVVRRGDLKLEILPKLDGCSGNEQIRRNFLAMLAVTQALDVRASEVVEFHESSEPFICALARLYCRRLLDAVRMGLRQDYIHQHDLLSHIRGKVDWPSQVKIQVTQRLDFSCIFDERSEDTPLNRTLKAALLAAGDILEDDERASGLVTNLRHVLDGISDVCPTSEQIARVQTDRMSGHLAPLLVLAKLILGNSTPDLGRSARGSKGTYAIVWDMNVLFEEYVGRMVGEVMVPKGFSVDLQEGAAAYLASEAATRKKAFLLRPDILVRDRRKPTIIADTKWKRLDRNQPNLGVSSADVYQMLAYANRYGTDSVVLVYPHHPGLGSPGVQRSFVIEGHQAKKVEVRVTTVDLSSLDNVRGDLEQSLGGEVPPV